MSTSNVADSLYGRTLGGTGIGRIPIASHDGTATEAGQQLDPTTGSGIADAVQIPEA